MYKQSIIASTIWHQQNPAILLAASPGNLNKLESQENDHKSIIMKMIEAFEEEMHKCHKEVQVNSIKQEMEINKIAQYLKKENRSNKESTN